MQPKVSIITPAYNCADFIESTIESVLSQDYTNWEMIIVDDCSKDETVEIIKKYQMTDKRIILHQAQSNLGAAGARNKCLELSTGRFIAYLDSDDLWTSDKLTKQVEFMIGNNYGFSCADYEVIDQYGNSKNKVIKMKKKSTYHGFLQNNLLSKLQYQIELFLLN